MLVLAQPSSLILIIWHHLHDDPPKFLGMIFLAHMREFVADDVIQNVRRSQHQSPIDANGILAAARTPTTARLRHCALRIRNAKLCRQNRNALWNELLRLPAGPCDHVTGHPSLCTLCRFSSLEDPQPRSLYPEPLFLNKFFDQIFRHPPWRMNDQRPFLGHFESNGAASSADDGGVQRIHHAGRVADCVWGFYYHTLCASHL